jgi:hypothetical protein
MKLEGKITSMQHPPAGVHTAERVCGMKWDSMGTYGRQREIEKKRAAAVS